MLGLDKPFHAKISETIGIRPAANEMSTDIAQRESLLTFTYAICHKISNVAAGINAK